MAVSKEDVIANLRAIIISSKGGLKLSDVRADYKETFGVDVPLKALGCSSLEEFFKNNSQDFSVIGNRVQAVAKSSSLHIVSLVKRQQTSKTRGRSKLFSKKASNLRKPMRSTNESSTGFQGKISNINSLGKFSRQNIQKNNLTTALKQMQQIQQQVKQHHELQQVQDMISTMKISQSDSQKHEKLLENKGSESTNQMKKKEELKEITRTIHNSNVSSAKELNFNNNNEISKDSETNLSKVPLPFEDFEDLHTVNKLPKPTQNLRKILSKKNSLEIEPTQSFNENIGPTSVSPFRRSLLKNSQEEILSAKRSAKTVKDSSIKNKATESIQNVKLDFNGNTEFEKKLKQLCIDKGLVLPLYSIIIREPKNQPRCYGCKLSIGDGFHVSTYPIETHDEATARELAAKKAYMQLSADINIPGLFYETEFVVKLRNLCLKKNLPEPIFKSLECHPKNEPRFFICKVKIGSDILLSSYPTEVHDELSARDLAAKKAYDHILSGSKPVVPISKNDTVTLCQIFDIVKTKEYGIWSNKLPNLYLDTYSEELQQNWFDLVKNSPNFEITTIEKVGFIIRTKNESSSCEIAEEPAVLGTLRVPESNQWEVYITNVVTSAEVWCRLIGKEYSEVYDTMMTKLELQPPTACVVKPIVGEIYLVNLEESWNRVKVIEINSEKEEASVFLIDIGVDEVIKISQLFYLQRSFFSVPPQALLLTLNELDCLAECEELQSALFHCLLGNTFIAEVVAIIDEGGNVCSVNLWDTSTDEDVNINLKLLDDVIKTIKSPSLPQIGLVKEMFVSYVDGSGDVYLQASKQSAQFVDYIISTKMRNTGKLVLVNGRVDPKKLYVTRSNKTGSYYRAKLIKSLDNNIVLVKFIDYGYEEQTLIKELFDLEETSLDLATIPSQVIRVKLANLKLINNKILAKIREQILEQCVLIKLTQILNEGYPAVEIFKRSQVDGTLSSVNNSIISNKQLQSEETSARKKSYVVGLENTLSRNLPMPNIPPIGSYFNVFVTLAAHPGLFNVQPLSTKNQLMELMFRLQEKCDASYSQPLDEKNFKIGELFAVKHADNFWYRSYAHAVISSSAFMVSLCDFGDFVMVPAEKLMPLPSEFKTFPYQAIRAYLAGIAPVNKDWSPEDCVKFRELVVEKEFVSQVVEINRDVKNPNYISLGLILVDTSTPEDIYIHQLLINMKMADLRR